MDPSPSEITRHTNRLAQESSPYLLQHAHNPVDWYPWGPEAFEKARKEDKPIFISVGYSTCYWCHVMERESFENEAVAAEMNRLFVNIKVDREERADVDQLYMTAVQVITQRGGWPMSVWLLPDLRPFYGGTYFPQKNFIAYLHGLEDAYRNRRKDVETNAEQITGILRRITQPSAPQKPLKVDETMLDSLIDRSTADYDRQLGGFGGAPKFPRETLLEMLLQYLAQASAQSQIVTRKSKIQSQLGHTLDAMAEGGIRDQLGGGFHRYSTDAEWLVPHFEIMLYDNAMLGWVYVEASRTMNEPRYAKIARGIFDFILREMTSPAGAFYTAFDAEVDAQEGLSYLWTAPEIETILGAEDAKLFNHAYGVDQGPNFADPHHGNGQPYKNILYLPQSMETLAAELKTDVKSLEERLAPMRQKLYDARLRRKQPMLDTKIITSWNALMIRAMAHGGAVLNEPRYVQVARRGAEFLLSRHRRDGVLFRTSRDGEPKYRGFLDDYAFLAQALLELSEATGEKRWRAEAQAISDSMIEKFWDKQTGGFFFTDVEATDQIVRQKTAQDSPLPSGNAVAAMVLLELEDAERSGRTLAAFAQQLSEQGEAMSSMAQAVQMYVGKTGPFTVSPLSPGQSADRPASPQQIAAGVVSVKGEWESGGELHVVLSILEGFHINAHETGGDLPLIATRLTVDVPGATVEYPPGEEQAFAFSERPIRVYSGEIVVRVRFSPPVKPETVVKLSLHYQACDESACFPPVLKTIEMDAPSIH